MLQICVILAVFASISNGIDDGSVSDDTRLIKDYYTANREKTQLVDKRLKESKRLRHNEVECSERRCCELRNDIDKELEIPSELNCKLLSDIECGKYDDFCEWNCHRRIDGKSGRFKRKFRGISYQNGKWKEPNSKTDSKTAETYDDFVEESKLVSIDECGIMYDEELPEEIVKSNWLNKKMDAMAKPINPELNRKRSMLDSDYNLGIDEVATPPSDDRVQVFSTQFPYSTVMYLAIEKADGNFSQCTATMISERVAITAAHCIYGDGDFFLNWALYENVLDCYDTVNPYYVESVSVFAGYINGETWDYDIGFMRLSTLNSGLGALGFGTKTVWSSDEHFYFNIISHPADKEDCSKWFQYCEYTDIYLHTMTTYDCDTFGGASGSSVYQFFELPENRVVYAIHAKGGCLLTYELCNTAILITAGKFSTICDFIEQYEPERCD